MPLSSNSTAVSLLVAACDGQTDAWRRLVQIYGPLVYGWCRHLGRQPADASDATQEVLLSVSRDLPRFDPAVAGATFRGWLWTITRRRLADQARRQARCIQQTDGSLAGVAQPVDAEPPTDAVSDRVAVLSRAVALLRDQFEPVTWQAFWATVAEGRDPAAVAADLGVSRWAVYKARARVLQRLREQLEGLS